MDPYRAFPAALALLALLAGACAPAAHDDGAPAVAVIGAPADARVSGAADALHDRLADLATGHDLVDRSSLAFLEVRSGLVGRRAATGAARVARNTGAEIAVTIGARVLTRELRGSASAPFEWAVVQLEVTVLDASDGSERARIVGPRLRGDRPLREDLLPELDEDRLVDDLVRRSVERLAPRVAEELREYAVTGSSGG